MSPNHYDVSRGTILAVYFETCYAPLDLARDPSFGLRNYYSGSGRGEKRFTPTIHCNATAKNNNCLIKIENAKNEKKKNYACQLID